MDSEQLKLLKIARDSLNSAIEGLENPDIISDPEYDTWRALYYLVRADNNNPQLPR